MKGFAKTFVYSVAGLGVLSPALGLAASGHPALAALYLWVLLLSSFWIGDCLNRQARASGPKPTPEPCAIWHGLVALPSTPPERTH